MATTAKQFNRMELYRFAVNYDNTAVLPTGTALLTYRVWSTLGYIFKDVSHVAVLDGDFDSEVSDDMTEFASDLVDDGYALVEDPSDWSS
jgi:hypothetical protein